MAKKNLHPIWHQTKIYCDGKLVLELGSTKEKLFVDIWSGNHPFYTGSQKILDAQGRIEIFEKRYKQKSTNLINNYANNSTINPTL